MSTRVVNIRHAEYDIYCGRDYTGHVPQAIGEYGWLGNPIKMADSCTVCGVVHFAGRLTIPCFERYFRRRVRDEPAFAAAVTELHGKTLGCFCHPNPCHAHVIARVVDELHDQLQEG